jgi:hypothetical protein
MLYFYHLIISQMPLLGRLEIIQDVTTQIMQTIIFLSTKLELLFQVYDLLFQSFYVLLFALSE